MSDSKKPTVSEIEALWDQATPGDWIVRVHLEKDDFFVEAPAAKGEAYGTEILGDEDYPTKRADAEAIVKAKAYHPYLLDVVKRLGEALEHLLSQSEIAEFNNMSVTATCELCSEVGGTMPTIPHKPDCAVKEARALLEEVKK